MLENIAKLDGKMDGSNIKCMPCGDSLQWGGFSPDHGVLLCQDKLRGRSETEDTLAHELVHVYDHLRFKVDWQDLKHQACSEVCMPTGEKNSRGDGGEGFPYTQGANGKAVWSRLGRQA